MVLLKAVQTLTSESLALMVLRNIPWVSWVGTEIRLDKCHSRSYSGDSNRKLINNSF